MSDASKTHLTSSKIILILAMIIAVSAGGAALWKKQGLAGEKTTAATAATSATDLSNATAKLESKLKGNPNDAEGWRMLGLAFFEQNKYAESATAYARATQIDPKRADYWSSLGESLVLAGTGEVSPDAKSAFEKAAVLDAKDPRARYFLGVAKDMAGNHKGAIDDWIALLKVTPPGAPWEADVRKLITDVAAQHKIDVTTRLAALRPPTLNSNATAAIPGPSPAEMRQASQLPKGQQDAMIQGMVDGLEAKLKANPNNVNGWIMLMRSRVQLGESAKAAAAFASAKRAFAGDQQGRAQIIAAAGEFGI
jgi:cytochrome c-type biogenesis protein CcmH